MLLDTQAFGSIIRALRKPPIVYLQRACLMPDGDPDEWLVVRADTKTAQFHVYPALVMHQ